MPGYCLGADAVPAVDPLGAADGPAGGEDHEEDDHDAEQDEGAGPQGEVLQVAAGQCARHGRRLRAELAAATPTHPHPRPPAPARGPEQRLPAPAEEWRLHQVQ